MTSVPEPPLELTFFPVVNFITGPPGVLRNGGIWKFIKRGIIHDLELPTIMTQVLHFVDFDVAKKSFEEWFKEDKTLKDWIREENLAYTPTIFADSGGFKLLYNKEYDLSRYGIEPTPESILKLQIKYGADYVASLDYPIPPTLNEKETIERMEKSIENAIALMELVYDNEVRVFPYLAVHGRTSFEIEYYMSVLSKRLEENGFSSYTEYPFGLAIGSMVPIKNHYELIIEIVHALRKSLSRDFSKAHKIPLHVFGISGKIIPFLYYLGINSFDSNTYVKTAQNLQFFVSYTQKKTFYSITNKDLCGCQFCDHIRGKNLSVAKKIMKKQGYTSHEFNGNKIVKSEIYGIIALHNLSLQLRLLEEIKQYKPHSYSFKEWLVNYSKSDRKLLKVISKLSTIDDDFSEISRMLKIKLPKTSNSEFYKFSSKKEISLKRDPNKFDINKIDYQIPREKKVILLLSCTPRKPYSKSSTHKSIYRYLKEAGIDLSKIEKVTLSGMYGPVPEEFEKAKPILEYDYVLSSRTPKHQLDIISVRLKEFLRKHAKDRCVVAYIGSKEYRKLVTNVQKELVGEINIILLPDSSKMTRKVNSEILKKQHLKELEQTIRKLLF